MLTREIVWPGASNDDIEVAVRSGNRVLFIFIEFLLTYENQKFYNKTKFFQPPIPEFSEDEEDVILLIELMQKCWNKEPIERPSFHDITQKLNTTLKS